MKRMKIILGLLLVTFTIACGQADKDFNAVVTFNKGFRFSPTGTIYTSIPSGENMIYPASGIPISTGTAWGTSIVNNSTQWNTAYSWGNHAGLYRPNTWKPDYETEVINKPTSIELIAALAELGIYLGKTTAELNAIVPVNGFGIALDKTTGFYKIYSKVLGKL